MLKLIVLIIFGLICEDNYFKRWNELVVSYNIVGNFKLIDMVESDYVNILKVRVRNL